MAANKKTSNSSKTAHVMNLLSKNREQSAPPPQANTQVSEAAPKAQAAPASAPLIISSMNADSVVASQIKSALETALEVEVKIEAESAPPAPVPEEPSTPPSAKNKEPASPVSEPASVSEEPNIPEASAPAAPSAADDNISEAAVSASEEPSAPEEISEEPSEPDLPLEELIQKELLNSESEYDENEEVNPELFVPIQESLFPPSEASAEDVFQPKKAKQQKKALQPEFPVISPAPVPVPPAAEPAFIAPAEPAVPAEPSPAPVPASAPAEPPSPAAVEYTKPSEPTPIEKASQQIDNKMTYVNVTQALVEEKTDKYMKMFGLCTCPRCVADVKALALNNLQPKYVVMNGGDIIPRITVYEGQFSASVIAQILHACKTVLENPRH